MVCASRGLGGTDGELTRTLTAQSFHFCRQRGETRLMTSVDPKVFRSYDIRALVPELVDETSEYYGKVGAAEAYQAPLTPDGVEQIGRGLADLFGERTVVIGYDARLSGPAWSAALARGMNRQGVDVIDIGLATTDM